jgi:hypothetical protein
MKEHDFRKVGKKKHQILSSYEREKPNATFNSGLKREILTILFIKCNLNQRVFKLYKTKRMQTNIASTCSIVVAHLPSSNPRLHPFLLVLGFIPTNKSINKLKC